MNDKLREHFGEYFDCPMGFVDQKIMELVNEYFDKIPDYFYEVPASSTGKNHPSFDHGTGGLLRHTQEYNNNYGTRLNTLRKKVQCIETNVIYDGLRIAQKETGIDRKNLSKACHQNTLAGGYHWRFYK